MANGQNAAQGMQASATITAASWTAQSNTYPIRPGYAQNIFDGDLVALDVDGFLVNYYDIIANPPFVYANFGMPATSQPIPTLGVFIGCTYATSNQAQVDYASPGRPYWPAGTTTAINQQPIGFVIDDPNATYNIQSGPAGFTQANCGGMVNVSYQVVGGLVQGNFQDGTSLMFANVAQSGQTFVQHAPANIQPGFPADSAIYRPLLVKQIVPILNNNAGVPYNNAEVVITNHVWRLGSTGN